MSEPGEAPVDAELAEENRLLRGWFIAVRDQPTSRTPLMAIADLWRRVRRRPTESATIDEALLAQTRALSALLRTANERGGLSDDLQFRIREALIHESIRAHVQDVPVGEAASFGATLIPALGAVAEVAGVSKIIWFAHARRLARLARRVLLERGLPDPTNENLPPRGATWWERWGLTTAVSPRRDPLTGCDSSNDSSYADLPADSDSVGRRRRVRVERELGAAGPPPSW
ncbi:MAG: hypothetical protein QOC77_386 [Thermoleophilaceae bacterium]|nr:hypothetical protein [Thermoleophilaceae bacterium]